MWDGVGGTHMAYLMFYILNNRGQFMVLKALTENCEPQYKKKH
jgi:hypothetical protein